MGLAHRGQAPRKEPEMQEARYSLNVRLQLGGYDAQITMRSDDSYGEIIDQMKGALGILGQGPKARPDAPPKPAPVPVLVPSQAPSTNGAGPKCPDHGRANKSKFGGLYCAGITEYTADGTAVYCKWTAKAA